MKISEHYQSYSQKTLIVVTNNELVKVFSVNDREINEIHSLKAKEIDTSGKQSGTSNEGPKNIDEEKKQTRLAMYKQLSRYLLKHLKREKIDIVLCAPEAYKNEIFEEMHADVKKASGEIIPKNLASLQLDQIVRILQEVR